MTIADLVTQGLRAMSAYHVPRPDGVRAKLDANESPHALPPELALALGRELATVPLHRYPEADPRELRAHVAAELGVAPGALVFGNGSDELLALLCAAFAEPRPGRARAAVLYPDPSFVVYRIAALGHGLEPIEVPLDDDMELDFDRVDAEMTRTAPNLAFFALPNNPTGTLWSPERVAALAAAHPGTIVVADEAYIDYGGRTLLPKLPELPNLVVMRTLSKLGLAGLRVGYLVADDAIVREVEKVRPPYNLGSLNQRAALWVLRQHGAWLRERAAEVVAERARLAAALATFPELRVFPSEANLILFRILPEGLSTNPGGGRGAPRPVPHRSPTDPPMGPPPDTRDSRARLVWRALAARGVLVRNLDRPGPLAGCLRVTPGTPEENDLFVSELRGALAGSGGDGR